MNVLVVDDAAFMRLTIRTMLEKHGFKVVSEAENGLQAVEKYIKHKPDLVTMDISMPEMTGLEAVKAIISLDNKDKIIMISAMGQEGMVKEAIINGAKGFVVKPFKEEHMIKTIKQLSI